MLSGRVDYSNASAAMLHAAANSALLNRSRQEGTLDLASAAGLNSSWDIQKGKTDLTFTSLSSAALRDVSKLSRSVKAVSQSHLADSLQLQQQYDGLKYRRESSAHRDLVREGGIMTRGKGANAATVSSAAAESRVASSESDTTPTAPAGNVLQIREKTWTSNDVNEVASAKVGKRIDSVETLLQEVGTLTERLIDRESLVVALRRRLREHEEQGPSGTLNSLTETLSRRREQVATLVLDHRLFMTESDRQRRNLTHEMQELKATCEAEQSRADRAEAQARALEQRLRFTEKANGQALASMDDQIGTILRNIKSLEHVLATQSLQQQQQQQPGIPTRNADVGIDKNGEGKDVPDPAAVRLRTRALSSYLLFGARTERTESTLEGAMQELAKQTLLAEAAQAEVKHLTEQVRQLKHQLAVHGPHGSGGGGRIRARCAMLLKLKQLEQAGCAPGVIVGDDRWEGGEGTGADETGAASDDGMTDLLVQAQDDFLFTQLLDARAQVGVLAQECAALRSKQAVAAVSTAGTMAGKGKQHGEGDASTESLKDRLVALAEELHDAKMAAAQAQAEAALKSSRLADAEARCLSATNEAQMAKSGSLRQLLPSGTETELRAQIMDLTSVRERLDGRVHMLERQNADAQVRHKSLQQMLVAERKLHHNTALIKDLREQVETLEEKVKGAEADPLQLLRGYNGLVSEDSERSLSSRVAAVEREKAKRYQDLGHTLHGYECQLQSVMQESYRYKMQALKWKNSKLALDKELLACRDHAKTLESIVALLEGNAQARADEIRPYLRAARLELVRSCFDLGTLSCKRHPDSACALWARGLEILSQVQGGEAVEWHTDAQNDVEHFQLEALDRANVLHKMGILLAEKTDFGAAKDVLQEAYDIRVEKLGEDDVRSKKSRMWLRRCLRGLGSGTEDWDGEDSLHPQLDERGGNLRHDEEVAGHLLSPTISRSNSITSLADASPPLSPEDWRSSSPLQSESGRRLGALHGVSLGDELGITIIAPCGGEEAAKDKEVTLPRRMLSCLLLFCMRLALDVAWLGAAAEQDVFR